MTETRIALGYYAGGGGRSPRPWAASVLTSSAIYLGLAIVVVTLGAAKQIARVAAVDVKFVERILNEPPPLAAPVVEAKPQAPAAAAPPTPTTATPARTGARA